MNNENKIYIGTYKVVKLFRVSLKRQVLHKCLSLERAKEIVQSHPDSNRSMVVFYREFSEDKYFTKD